MPTPRLGGAAFVPVLLAGMGFGWLLLEQWDLFKSAMLVGAGVLYVVGLIDDFSPLSARLRMAVQIVVACATLATTWRMGGAQTGVGNLTIVAGIVCLVMMVGVINIFNFMDGIDGIAAIQALIGGAAWAIFAWQAGALGAAWSGLAIATVAASFLFHNWSPASIFMGDAGSTVLGFLLVALPFFVWIEGNGRIPLANLVMAALLVLWPFLIDGTSTILRRAMASEDIFAAHSSHLYQRLARAHSSHSTVSMFYGALAVYGAIVGWWMLRGFSLVLAAGIGGVALLYAALWRHTVSVEARAKAEAGGELR